jgi:Domain of unknown function (DUF1735)
MKHHKIYIIVVALITLTQVSCLKDKLNNSDPAGGSNNVVEFQNSSVPVSYSAVWPQYDNGVTLTNDTGSFPINFNYAGAIATTPQDINITIAIDTAALSAFNNDQGTSYVPPPADCYTLPTSATITKGGSWSQIWVKINTAAPDYDYNASYALPLTIVSASYGVVSSNFGTAIYSFVGNNPWAATYTTTGYFFHPTDERAISGKFAVTTAGQFANTFPFGDLPSAAGISDYFIVTVPTSPGALTNYQPSGGTPVPPASGFMDADDPGGIYTPHSNYPTYTVFPGGSGPWLSSTYNNTIDASGTFWIHVGYATGGNGENTYSRQVYMQMVHP